FSNATIASCHITLSLHDALPISGKIAKTEIHFGGALPFLDGVDFAKRYKKYNLPIAVINDGKASVLAENWLGSLKDMKNCASITDRKSTRLNSSHVSISYAVYCL